MTNEEYLSYKLCEETIELSEGYYPLFKWTRKLKIKTQAVCRQETKESQRQISCPNCSRCME